MSIKATPKLDKVIKKFSRISPIINKNLTIALKKAAFLVERESKFVTPVDTGRLRSSIFTTIKRNMAIIQPKTDYAIYVHEGTRRMTGKPFMKEGFDKSKSRIDKLFKGAVKTSINKALK